MRAAGPSAWIMAVAIAAALPAQAVAADESDGTAELLAVAIPALITAVVLWTLFYIARARFPNVYAPRANWMRNAYDSVELPNSISFLKVLYDVPESEMIVKVGADGAVFLRVFKLGIDLFAVCSVVAIALIAVNTQGGNGLRGLDSLSMANVKDESPLLWCHVVGMWVISGIAYYTLRKNYNEIFAITQEYKSTSMQNYAVMVRNLPEELCNDEALLAYFKNLYPDTHDAILARQIGNLAGKVAEFTSVTLDLEKTRIKWDRIQNDPMVLQGDKVAVRPTTRKMSVMDPAAGLEKVDKLEYLEARQRKLREEIDALRAEENALVPSSTGFVTFTSTTTANAAAQTLQAMVPGTVDMSFAPEPREVYWPGVVMTPLKRMAGSHTVTLLKIPLIWGYIIAILFITSLQNLESLTQNRGMGWLGFINDLPPTVRGIIQGLIPVILLAVLMAILPMVLRKFAQRAGLTSESEIQAYVFGTHYAYQVVFVFFLTMLASAIFDSLNEVIDKPAAIFTILGGTVPGAGDFFIAYVLLQGLGKFSFELVRIVPLILSKFFLRSAVLDTERMKIMEPGSIDYGKQLPQQLVIYLIVLAYAVLHPIISFFGVIYFSIGYMTWKHQLLMLYTTICESGGTNWHRIFKFIMVGVVISQATLIGVVAAKKGVKMGPFLLPLPVISYFFYSHFDSLYASTVSSKVVAREVARKADDRRGMPTKADLDRVTVAFKQPELVYDLDDILYHSSLRCTASTCLADPPPPETWLLYPGDLHQNLLYDLASPGTGKQIGKASSPQSSDDDVVIDTTVRYSVV
mmetsp:Transcript_20394/g.52998  ORF Transcript_20394/g.52998 Transcript_20394/m.52998 type:complete len:803 (+) Transcript_20394:300-2708(+)